MIKIKNIADMQHFAEAVAKNITAPSLILLNGDLGAGKTTLSQFIGKALGVKRTINSPTFNIIKSYNATNMRFHHMDCYRLEDSDEDLGFDEYFDDDALTIIEWSTFISDLLPDTYLEINITIISETERMIECVAIGEQYEKMKEDIIHDLSMH